MVLEVIGQGVKLAAIYIIAIKLIKLVEEYEVVKRK